MMKARLSRYVASGPFFANIVDIREWPQWRFFTNFTRFYIAGCDPQILKSGNGVVETKY